MQRDLRERNDPAVFVAGVHADALNGAAKECVSLGHVTAEVGEDGVVQRGAGGLAEIDGDVLEIVHANERTQVALETFGKLRRHLQVEMA